MRLYVVSENQDLLQVNALKIMNSSKVKFTVLLILLEIVVKHVTLHGKLFGHGSKHLHKLSQAEPSIKSGQNKPGPASWDRPCHVKQATWNMFKESDFEGSFRPAYEICSCNREKLQVHHVWLCCHFEKGSYGSFQKSAYQEGIQMWNVHQWICN